MMEPSRMPVYGAMHTTRPNDPDTRRWFARLWRWLGLAVAADAHVSVNGRNRSQHVEEDTQLMALASPSMSATAVAKATGQKREDNVVDFPVANRNVLVRLAHELGACIDDSAALCPDDDNDPVLLLLTTGSAPRLWVDSTSHVEVCEASSVFRVVLGENLDTRVSLETREFDRVKQFIWEYLLATHGRDVEVGERT